MLKTEIEAARAEVRRVLSEGGITLGPGEEIEITDFGKGNFHDVGLALIIRISEEEYASKWLVVFPNQECPNHYHERIKETFFLIRGDVTIWINGREVRMQPGDKVTLPPCTWHSFRSESGAIIEEVTNRQFPNDSIFEDKTIERYVRVQEG